MNSQNLFGHLLALLTILIWGTTFISTKIILKTLSPLEILLIRFLIAYIFLWLIHPKKYGIKNLRQELHFFGMGFTGITLYFLTENIALQHTLAANVGLLISAAPILTAIIAHYVTSDERLKPNLLIGFIIAIIGVFLVIFNGSFLLQIDPFGDCLALSAALIWAVYSILLKSVDQQYHPIYVVRRTFFYGLTTGFPLLFFFGRDLSMINSPDASLILNLLFLGLAASSLCFVMWNKAVRIIGIVKTSNYIYLVPLITMVTSILVLKEQVNWLMIMGGILILGGVYVSEQGLKIPLIPRKLIIQ